jgi:NAD(P)-dependent dehydrogenase (short-subunit alcohol dehydrogenase family)
MPTIAIVGAGPGMGLSIAKAFGSHGFQVALISRSKDNLDAGIHAAVVSINLLPAATAPDGVPHAAPDDIAQVYWDLHARRDRPEHVVSA